VTAPEEELDLGWTALVLVFAGGPITVGLWLSHVL
jgi:hypothetical protein